MSGPRADPAPRIAVIAWAPGRREVSFDDVGGVNQQAFLGHAVPSPKFWQGNLRGGMAFFAKDQAGAITKQPGSVTDDSRTSVSVLGPEIQFDGTITGRERLIIEGIVKGKIDLESELRIAPTARVEATVHARTVYVEGALIGDVSADHKIELVASANVDGNIKAPKVVVAEGAKFRGAVDMGSDKPKE